LSAGDGAGAQAPVCCFTKGEHHCLGQMPGSDGSPVFSAAVVRCPYGPLALAALQGPSLDRPQKGLSFEVSFARTFLSFESYFSNLTSFVSRSFERGPPSFLN
jgi:hypothetical protein